jgi:hypothetical protein
MAGIITKQGIGFLISDFKDCWKAVARDDSKIIHRGNYMFAHVAGRLASYAQTLSGPKFTEALIAVDSRYEGISDALIAYLCDFDALYRDEPFVAGGEAVHLAITGPQYGRDITNGLIDPGHMEVIEGAHKTALRPVPPKFGSDGKPVQVPEAPPEAKSPTLRVVHFRTELFFMHVEDAARNAESHKLAAEEPKPGPDPESPKPKTKKWWQK